MEIAKLIETGFTTADAEYPTLLKEGGGLTLKFEDWREQVVEVFFGEVVAFTWQECVTLLEGERDDSCYQILDSHWIKSHIEQDLITSNEGYNHYRFNFNDCGQLDVICIGFGQKT